MSEHLQLNLYSNVIILVIGLMVGWLLGDAWAGVAVAALLSLSWQWLHMYRLDGWLLGGGAGRATIAPWTPDDFWREVYQRYGRLHNSSVKNKRKLSRTLRNLQDGVDAIPDAIVVLNATDRMLWCNPAARSLLGLVPERDRGRSIEQLIQEPNFLAYVECWPAQETVCFDAPNDPHRKLRGQLLPYTKRQRMLWVSDITQAYRVEQMRRDFVSSASHELRTPLTVIVGYLEILREHIDPQESIWAGPLTAMQQQSDRMMTILRELLLLSRLEDHTESGRHDPVNIPQLLRAIVDDARSLSGERQHLITLQAQPDLWLNGTVNDLHSAFSNLVFNAVHHTPPGSGIQVRWYCDDVGVYLTVTDNGDGIPEQHLPRLTERFYRVDKSRQRDKGYGTGLGLAIVKHVLQRHQGELHISSKLGVGSCFICKFPLLLLTSPQVCVQDSAAHDPHQA